MAINHTLVDLLRRGRSAHENHLIDGLARGTVSRREFLRYGSVLGLSAPLLGSIAAAIGYSTSTAHVRAATAGGTIRVAQIVPAATIDPVKIADSGGITVLSQVAETLVLSAKDLTVQPLLAESWSTNKDGTVWTFTLRKGVKFHDGRPLTAEDVVATFDRLADPEMGSNALSVFSGLLSKGGTRKVDDHKVEFHLDSANGNFPYAVSTDNYNAVIIPADSDADYEKTMIGTGPFKLEKYTAKSGASFVRNPDYWGGPAGPDRVEINFYDDYQPQIIAMQAGEVDVITQIPVLQGIGLLSNPDVDIISTPSTAHQQVHMRTDVDPFKDKRVRRAIALCLDRPSIVKGLMKDRAMIGNDSPFASSFPSTDRSVPQREKNISEAKQLMEASGMAGGFKATLTTEKYLEIPDYAVLIQNAVKEIGGAIDINIMAQGAYYGDAIYGKSPWLDCDMGITDYGHRGVPNVILAAPLISSGTWNSAHFKNAEYDNLVKSYVAALDLDSQRESASKIQTLLLDETPILFTYFYDFLTATKKGTTGVQPTAMSHLFLREAAV
ncbi:peptide ABC transporter substrate-binding protein (plasmid) [Mesorhizobium sp. WSM1497]|uniref:ABC transporter substrate-binding protein n=1 Tax=Mesorhizobium sp. WSM1497 TaxID=278153 RepID=UPI0007EC6968|nr:ABC transporter substrate-binding protein [Mesorhizobium sp. WSM1497]ARP68188.1 peptide ABC transporter substrate-binding protein [Mesorhizobium sp. WSM1497]